MMTKILFVTVYCVLFNWTAISGQETFKRLSVEASMSIGPSFNKGSVIGTAYALSYVLSVDDSRPAVSHHWTGGLGYHLTASNSIWLRIGRNDPAIQFDGVATRYYDDFSYSTTVLTNMKQHHTVDILRLEYEYRRNMGNTDVTLGGGYQHQRNFSLIDKFLSSEDFQPTTHALTAFVGMTYPLHASIELTGRLRVINTFRSSDTVYLWIENDLVYSPFQVLAELGIRYSFLPRKGKLAEG